MKITLKPICQEILGAMPGGSYDVPEQSTARDALLHCIAQYGGSDVLEDCVCHIVYMRNGKHCSPDEVLAEGDLLMALRPVYGG